MESVIFRPFCENDYLLINKWRNDPELQLMTGGNFRYVSLEIERNWVKDKMLNNKTDIYLAICLNDDSQKMIGYLSFNKIDHLNRTAECGGLIIGDKDYRDGIIWIECNLFIMSYAFDVLNLNRVSGSALTTHKLTMTMNLSLLFWQLEGICKQAVYKRGEYHDLAIFALLRESYLMHKTQGDYQISSILKRVREIKKESKQIK